MIVGIKKSRTNIPELNKNAGLSATTEQTRKFRVCTLPLYIFRVTYAFDERQLLLRDKSIKEVLFQ